MTTDMTVLLLHSVVIPEDFLPSCHAGEWMEGRNKCDWSSCREGCTKVRGIYFDNKTVSVNIFHKVHGYQ